ncbi:MAG TPA: hypothetical protein H9679_01520 [Firmicutes bacterium]|nr:hypothetical protein [Bacillota bacterium]
MSGVKQKNLAASLAIIVLEALFLLGNYSVEGVVILVLLAVYLLVQNVFTVKEEGTYGISDFLGGYIGAGLTGLLLMGLTGSQVYRMVEAQVEIVGFIILGLLALVFWMFTGWLRKGNVILRFLAFAVTYVGYLLVLLSMGLQISWETLCLLTLATVLVFALAQYIQNHYGGMVRKSTFNWMHLFLLAVVVVGAIWPNYLSELLLSVQRLPMLDFWPLYLLIAVILLFAAVALVCSIADKKSGVPAYDVTVVLAALFHVLLVPFAQAFFSPFLLVFIVLLLVLDAVVFFRSSKEEEKTATLGKTTFRVNNLLLVGGVLALTVLYLALLYGRILPAIALAASAVVLFFLRKAGSGVDGTLFWIVAVLLIGLVGILWCSVTQRTISACALIFCVCVISAFSQAVLGVRNAKQPRPEKGLKLTVTLATALLVVVVGLNGNFWG